MSLTMRAKISIIFSGAFIFLAALAWRDAVESFINRFVPKGDILLVKFLWALTITVVVIWFLYFLDEHILGVRECDKK